jgi:hypothetical protein
VTFGFGPGGSSISSKPNAPFSAIAIERFKQTLNDGTNISRENQETVMRDSAGEFIAVASSTDQPPPIVIR